MEWYFWVLQIWLCIMLLFAISGLFSFEGARVYILNLVEAVGAACSIVLLLVLNEIFFNSNSKQSLLIVTVVVGVCFAVSFLSDIFRSPEDVEEDEQKLGRAALDAMKESREGGADYIEAGLSGALAAESEKRWNVAAIGVSMLLLFPNLVALILGIRALV
jgi:hypothetical protein